VTDLEVWLWICGEKEVEVDLHQYIWTTTFGETYVVHYANYEPSLFEHIVDFSDRSSKAKEIVQLIFSVKKAIVATPIPYFFLFISQRERKLVSRKPDPFRQRIKVRK